MSTKLVIVESPAKAKTINMYLGKDFTVLASFGHIRDLPPKDGSVRPSDGFAMDWELIERAKRPLGEIVKALKNSDAVYLATDPDREGEAIAWHLREYLREKKLAAKLPLRRVTFHEITRTAVAAAIVNPRDIDQELVDAYFARRALDYLVGFSLSPVLWQKLPGAKSAGRVQSVALRLICERESEIETFKSQDYWTIEGDFAAGGAAKIPARLTHLYGQKLGKFSIPDEKTARDIAERLKGRSWTVATVERKRTNRNPHPPFTTSTLQQEASRKLSMAATQTMRIAQQLYEGVDIGGQRIGLITYMRTDGISLSNEAIQAARQLIESEYGASYLPASPRTYKNPAKNAQEAHEAIRPTDLTRRPEELAKSLTAEQLNLYRLIWQRTLASQMANAVLDQVAVDIASQDPNAIFRATGSVVAFDGFLKLYTEDRDEEGESEDDRRLPDVSEGQALALSQIIPERHSTQPPPRYSEASLVKTMEELGIGRPSTYASIMQVLQDRSYVTLEKRRFVPSDRGRLVTSFLANFFLRYVEHDFTADLEQQLDDISGGRLSWKKVLSDFWQGFSAAITATKHLELSGVAHALDQNLATHFFPWQSSGPDPRQCPVCHNGRLSLRLGAVAAFIGCANYPRCTYTRPLDTDRPGESNPRDGTQNPCATP